MLRSKKDMDKNEFNVEVDRLKKSIGDKRAEEERKNLLLEKELPLALRFSKGLKKLGTYVSDSGLKQMIEKYREFQSSGLNNEDVIEATVLWAAEKNYVHDEVKISRMTKKVLSYNPVVRVALIRFKKKHPFLSASLFVMSVIAVEFAAMSTISALTASTFLLVYMTFVVTGAYAFAMVSTVAKYLSDPR